MVTLSLEYKSHLRFFHKILIIYIISILVFSNNQAIDIIHLENIDVKSINTDVNIVENSISPISHSPEMSSDTNTVSSIVNLDAFANFSGNFGSNELNSYYYNDRINLLNSSDYSTLYGNLANSYVADIKIDQSGDIYILGGFDQQSVDINSLNNLITNTGNEKSNTSNPLNVKYIGLILKFSKNNTLLYGSVIDSPSANDVIFSTFEFDSLGNIIILGSNGTVITNGNIDLARTDNSDVYLIKMNSNFDIITTKIIGGSYLERIGIRSSPSMKNTDEIKRFIIDDVLDLDSQGNIIIVGTTTSFDNGSIPEAFPIVIPFEGTNDLSFNNTPSSLGENAFIVKLDSNLNYKWSRIYTGTDIYSSIEKVGAVVVGPDDKIYVGGYTDSDTLPTGITFPLNDTITNGESAVNHQRTIPSPASTDAFIAVFQPNGSLYTATYLGASLDAIEIDGNDNYIYTLDIDTNGYLYVGGEVKGNATSFPLISPIENELGYDPTVFDKHQKTGFILVYNTLDYNITFSHRFILGNGSAITDIKRVGDSIYYSGVVEYTTSSINVDPPKLINLDNMTGPYADTTFNSINGNTERDLSGAIFGILNISRDVNYLTQTDFGDDLVYSAIDDEYWGTPQGSASGRIPFVVDPTNDDIYLGIDNFYNTHIKRLSILDTDSDGLSDWNEDNVYGTDKYSADTDGDTLTDGEEIYALNIYNWSSDPLLVDSDGDCINDDIEILNGLNPGFKDANIDLDGDGINSFDEFHLGLNITNPDTDGDGINDFDEVFVTFTNGSNPDSDGDSLNDSLEISLGFDPWDADMDDDGLTDAQEYYDFYPNPSPTKTDPKDPDTDDDGLSDGLEAALFNDGYQNNRTNPVMYDYDSDGLSDYEEYMIFATFPGEMDMDGDGLNDTEELLVYFTDVTKSDPDGDGLNDTEEVKIYFTDPYLYDTDNDTLSDYYEVMISNTDPLNADIDNDGLNDAQEIAYGSLFNNNDTDGDLLPDLWEYTMGLNSSLNETYTDYDNDNMTAIMEYYNNTHPGFADIDNDNLTDYEELYLGTDPWYNDTDTDGLLDNEGITYGTSPLLADSDGDGLSDKYELDNNMNPIEGDMDGDNLNDGLELQKGTDPNNNDTDSDGILDGYERYYFTDPLNNDTDSDGLLDGLEVFYYFTNPISNDTDNDNLNDLDEIIIGTDPNDDDTDNDYLTDGLEILIGSSPILNDTDSDTLYDGLEVLIFNTSPVSNDTDGDKMPDDWEVQFMYFNDTQYLYPSQFDADADPDKDKLSNMNEYLAGTDPTNPDTDADGLLDGFEVEKEDQDPLDPTDGRSYREQVKQGLENNPLLLWSSILSGLSGLVILLPQLINWLKSRAINRRKT